MDARNIFGVMAGLIDILAYIPYFLSVIRGENKPNQASWLIWTFVKIIVLMSCLDSGARNTIWLPAAQIVGNATIAIVSIRYGRGGWSRLDRSCIALAFLSVIPIIIFKMPMVTLGLNMFIELMGTLPTFNKLYSLRKREDLTAWAMIFLACVLSALSVERAEFRLLLYPLFITAVNGSILALVILNFRRGKS